MKTDMVEAYRKDPCRMLSIPYWKNKNIRIPENMRIVHDTDYRAEEYGEYHDEPYFRLYHALSDIQTITVEDISIVTVKPEDIPALVDVINRSYIDLTVTVEQLNGYTRTEVFCPKLWICAVDQKNAVIAGCGIADIDREVREGILEWIQVLPEYRGRGIGKLIVNELLKRMVGAADFATLSGKVNNLTAPEKLYRKCGFVGRDVWHILTR